MAEKNTNLIFLNICKIISSLADVLIKTREKINVLATSEILVQFLEFLDKFPDDIKKTQLYDDVMRFNDRDLRYEDVVSLFEEFSFGREEICWEKCLDSNNKNVKLYEYVKDTIKSETLGKREKITILLVHMEALITDMLGIAEKSKTDIKKDVKRIAQHENKGISAENFAKIYILAITLVVFSNTKSYEQEIDKRLPFRNNILHKGIVEYDEEEVNAAYDILVDMIDGLVQAKITMKQ